MKDAITAWNGVVNKFYKDVKPEYLKTFNEIENLHINNIKDANVEFRGTFSTDDINDYHKESFVTPFKNPFRKEITSMDTLITSGNHIINRIGSETLYLDSIIQNASSHVDSMKPNKNLVFNELVAFERENNNKKGK
jgi:hypothetical protein